MTPTEALIVLLSPAGLLPLATVATMSVAAIDHWRRTRVTPAGAVIE